MANETKPVGETKTRELTLTRTFNLPLKQVWKAWTDPQQLSQWWGPKGFTNPRCDWDVKRGGAIYIEMKAPDGTIYPMDGKFVEVEELKTIAFKTSALDNDGKPIFQVHNTITFAERDGKTDITLKAVASYTKPEATQYLDGMKEGWSQSLDKLAALLGDGKALKLIVTAEQGKHEFSYTRMLDAPVKLVFEAFTEPQHIINWWGPRYLMNTVEKMDAKTGGSWRIIQRDPKGKVHAFHGVHHEVTPTRIVRTFEYEGMPGHVALETVTFEELGNKTRIKAQSVFQSVEDRDGMISAGAESGMNEGMERLDELLEKMKQGK